jgi:hypothetical protein
MAEYVQALVALYIVCFQNLAVNWACWLKRCCAPLRWLLR